MRSKTKITLLAALFAAVLATTGAGLLCACQSHPETVTVTFRAANEEDTVIEIKYGGKAEAPAVPDTVEF